MEDLPSKENVSHEDISQDNENHGAKMEDLQPNEKNVLNDGINEDIEKHAAKMKDLQHFGEVLVRFTADVHHMQ